MCLTCVTRDTNLHGHTAGTSFVIQLSSRRRAPPVSSRDPFVLHLHAVGILCRTTATDCTFLAEVDLAAPRCVL